MFFKFSNSRNGVESYGTTSMLNVSLTNDAWADEQQRLADEILQAERQAERDILLNELAVENERQRLI
jgi:hypothetical protein